MCQTFENRAECEPHSRQIRVALKCGHPIRVHILPIPRDAAEKRGTTGTIREPAAIERFTFVASSKNGAISLLSNLLRQHLQGEYQIDIAIRKILVADEVACV